MKRLVPIAVAVTLATAACWRVDPPMDHDDAVDPDTDADWETFEAGDFDTDSGSDPDTSVSPDTETATDGDTETATDADSDTDEDTGYDEEPCEACIDGTASTSYLGSCETTPDTEVDDPPIVEEIGAWLDSWELACDDSPELTCDSDWGSFAVVVSGPDGWTEVAEAVAEYNPEVTAIDVDFAVQRVLVVGGVFWYCTNDDPWTTDVHLDIYSWPDGGLHFEAALDCMAAYEDCHLGNSVDIGRLFVVATDQDPTICLSPSF